MKIVDEFKSFFRNPRDIHRVFMIAPLGAMLSHAVYLGSKSGDLPFTKDEIMSIVLGVVLYGMITLWTIFSNTVHFRLIGRFVFMAGYGAFAHRMILGIGSFTGISMFELVFSLSCMTIVAFFVATGFSINEAKDKLNEITQKPKDPGTVGRITNLDERRATS